MPRCVVCQELTRATCYCAYFNVYLKPAEIHRGGRCDGYKWKKFVEAVA